MTIADRAILVTGANRGIGKALVEEALRRGAKRVYAGMRQPLAHSDGRVTPLTLDVTNAAQIQGAVERVESLDILVNNAGLALYDDLSDRGALEQHLAVNLYGTYTDMSRGLDVPKASPESVARAIFEGVEKGEEDIFPDPMSESMAESWRSGAAKALERQNAVLAAAVPVKG
jgi:NAD(P)-dependent dehydrogenase (short-subunit alcohol dehydrogenase family)